ncbi:hypothetical protein [Streptomyces sp. GC420]|uniref:hypothetical protein n=1 Tax=Streptomyces sp. GC420 TaxID=2697568 RepID=UPI001414FB83|nr:hypothetical protein [Streptomyces sp. GC420]NBM14704.1 hypothetical protein [Streptomyces sp. GC420]
MAVVVTQIAFIVLAAATVASVIIAVWTYRRSAQAQVSAAQAQLQLSALGILQHYLDLAVERTDLASPGDERPADARYAWFAAHALNTAQTLQRLVGEHPDWQRAINAIIRRHRPYLTSGAFVCDDFTPGFVEYLRERVPELRCADDR